jgi:hypothetical protein
MTLSFSNNLKTKLEQNLSNQITAEASRLSAAAAIGFAGLNL